MSSTTYQGLSQDEVAQRIQAGQVNTFKIPSSRSLLDILRANIFTRFNALLGVLFVIVISVGFGVDALFAVSIVINSGIGIVQEWRAKRLLDRLAILHRPMIGVVRDGKQTDIPIQEVVLDDILTLKVGDQLPVDGEILSSEGLEIDESLLTGESESVIKKPGDNGLSGSIVVAGRGYLHVTAVGSHSYAQKFAGEAKKFSPAHSELMEGINTLLRYIAWTIAIVGPFLVWRQLVNDDTWEEAVIRSTAAITGMIPEGLVLLTSLTLALATINLARRKVLVQQLPAVEGLARVDVICLDKTGTLTDGRIKLEQVYVFDASQEEEKVERVLATFAEQPDSLTLHAIHDALHEKKTYPMTGTVPFSSVRKWSSITLKNGESWILGAPEFVDSNTKSPLRIKAQEFARRGKRVIALFRTDTAPNAAHLPKNVDPVGLIVLTEHIRPEAGRILNFFAKQGVAIKLLSGDNPETVAAIARGVGLEVGEPIDARSLPSQPEELRAIVKQGQVFGRVTPEQKRDMIEALQLEGHTVAMTGDGVNDTLALKRADIGIAMGNGTSAAKAVSEIVLLDSQFGRLPNILAEGRRIIGNIERVANLFVVKNVYTLVIALGVIFANLPFPFLPRHFTLISSLTIGIPAFFLALSPNSQRSQPGFLRRVLGFALPTGLVIGILTFVAYLPLSYDDFANISLVTGSIVMITGTWVLYKLAKPLTWRKVLLVVFMPIIFLAVIYFPAGQDLFYIAFERYYLGFILGLGGIGILATELIWRYSHRVEEQVE